MEWKDRITKVLAETGLSQQKLADSLGVTQHTIRNWLNASSTPHTGNKVELIRKLESIQQIAKNDLIPQSDKKDKQIVSLKADNLKLEERIRSLESASQDGQDYLVDKLLDRLGGVAQSELEMRIRELEFKLQEMNMKPTRASSRLEQLELKLSSLSLEDISQHSEKVLADIVILSDSVKDIDRKRSSIESKIRNIEERVGVITRNIKKIESQ